VKHAEYAALDAVNWSTLKHLADSPAHYRYRLRVPVADTPALQIGRLIHTLVFEPGLFAAEYAVWDGGRRAGKEWENFKGDHAGQTIFKADEVDEAVIIAETVRRSPLVQPYLDGGIFEHLVRWTDAETGLACKAKVDWWLPGARILLDLKSARTTNAFRFGAAAGRYKYHCQLAMYAAGIEASTGTPPARVLVVAVEKDAPYDVAVFELDAEAMQLGREEVRQHLLMLRACREADRWPGRYDREMALVLPRWMTMTDDEDASTFDLDTGE
jgi:hypothetical protein